MSLSARRAWIEIELLWGSACRHYVALRKESVDRNALHNMLGCLRSASLSARRAWIEIADTLAGLHRKAGRSPQGERG